jgi:cold shock CspA family protein
VVETFNEQKGWGFILADSGESFYLHRSEVEDGRLPIPGRRVAFYRGFREKRPRACYVRMEIDGR